MSLADKKEKIIEVSGFSSSLLKEAGTVNMVFSILFFVHFI
jgi:hypothetical protein